jgi:hypothetical protein
MDEIGIAFIAAHLLCNKGAPVATGRTGEGFPPFDKTRPLTREEAVAEAIALTDEACRQMAARRQKGIKKGR